MDKAGRKPLLMVITTSRTLFKMFDFVDQRGYENGYKILADFSLWDGLRLLPYRIVILLEGLIKFQNFHFKDMSFAPLFF